MTRSIDKMKRWGSHVPLLHTIMNNLEVNTIIECGMGRSSTPLFLSYGPTLLKSYEHDDEWFDTIVSEVKDDPAFSPRLIKLNNGISHKTRRRSASQEQIEELDLVYAGIASELANTGRFDLLFVDTISAARLSSLQQLHHLARIILFHDSEPRHFLNYGYDRFVSEHGSKYERYSYRPANRNPWSEMFLSEKVDADAFLNELRVNSRRFFGDGVPVTFVVHL